MAMGKKFSNERITENIVRKLLGQNGYLDDASILVEEQMSRNPKINALLQQASKSGKSGPGRPEFIISFDDEPDNIVIIECKANIAKHESEKRDKYKDFAVDGALRYASFLKDQFNVMAIAVSGETEREIKISHFLWIKGKHIYKDTSDQHLLNAQSLFNLVREQSAPLKEDELIKKAIEYNELLHSYSIPEIERCTLISAILVALQDEAFSISFKSHYKKEDADDPSFNPNESLIEALLQSCENVLRRNSIRGEKSKTILREYDKIKQNHILKNKTIRSERTTRNNTVLRDLIDDIYQSIMPYVNNDVFDVLGQFYTQFIRYAGSDSKTGLVLTPVHITDFFCDIAQLHENDIVFDPCCGTGGFLVAAMKHMLAASGNNLEKQKSIKSKQLIGIERRADMFSHACSNMMMRGDGKSHIHFGDCFDDSLKALVKKENPNKGFLNPPYDVGEIGQLEFIENCLDCITKDGICVAICQTSTVVSTAKNTIIARERLLATHTLEGVFSMPNDLFHPVGVTTCIIVFKAHNPHPKNKESYFGYYKEDGFLKSKHQGRIDRLGSWDSIKSRWIDTYINKKSIKGLSVMKHVDAKDEWCAEAYMETDYSTLTREDFERDVKKFALYKLMLEIEGGFGHSETNDET